jgi:hypothetical protein
MLQGGVPLADIANAFINSAEFQAHYGALSNTQFVTLMYNNALDRAPDPAGFSGWLSYLDGGGSRASLVVAFSESAEAKATTQLAADGYATTQLYGDTYGQVYRMYGTAFDRAPDAPGFEVWDGLVAGGLSLTTMASSFLNSAEFQTRYGTLSNSDFVTLLYNNALDRAPDPAGFSGWLSYLNGGGSRASLMVAFSESAEYRNNSVATLESFMQDSLPQWADVLDGNLGNDRLMGGRGSDRFVFDATQDGSDRVLGLEAWDELQFSNFGYTTPADAMSHMTQVGRDVVFADQGVNVTFANTQLTTLQHPDYFFV